MFKRLIAALVCLSFSFSNFQYVQAQPAPQQAGDFSVNQLPVPGTMIGESAPFAPLALKGLIVNPQKPLEFQFIVDTGKGSQDSVSIKDQVNQLVKYFLAGLTIPEGDLWVNLSPYEKNRMVPEALGQTDLGRDLLAQDYILKQLTASLIYPEKDLGKEFWSRVYAKAQAQFGTTNAPVNTFNKVWILPDQAQVFENVNATYVTKSTLKIMLDEDYTALQKDLSLRGAEGDAAISNRTTNSTHSIASQIVREIVLPEIEKEVNTGKNFAPLRQIYQALILAKWYKQTIQNGLLDALYTNKYKVAGVNLNDPAVNEQIYQRYLLAYKKGAFNYIKEDPTPDGQVVPRKYFSGGILPMRINLDPTGKQTDIKGPDGAMVVVTIGLVAAGALGGVYFSYILQSDYYRNRKILLEGNEEEYETAKSWFISSGKRYLPKLYEMQRKLSKEELRLKRRFNRNLELSIGEQANLARLSRSDIRVVALIQDIEKIEHAISTPTAPTVQKQILDALMDVTLQEAFDYKVMAHNNFEALDLKARTQFDPQKTDPGVVEAAIQKNNGSSESMFQHIRVNSNEAIKQTYKNVQNIVREVLGHDVPVLDMNLNDIHVTIANDDLPIASNELSLTLDQLVRDIAEDARGVKPFDIQLVGPHLMPNGVIVMEYTTSAPEFLYLRKKAEKRRLLRQLSQGNRAFVPNIIHSTVSIIRDSKVAQETLNKLRERLDTYRHQLTPIEVRVNNITATHFRESDRHFIKSEDIPLVDAKTTTDNKGAEPDEAMNTTEGPVQHRIEDKAMDGGIDLNQIKVLRNGKTVNVQFDPAQLIELEQGGFKGFRAVITSMTPILSPFPLLGINAPKEQVLAKV